MEFAALQVRAATRSDAAFLVTSIQALADYERLSADCKPVEQALVEHLFGARPYAEALIAEIGRQKVGYALFFHSYSSFLTRPGVYVEDLFVHPDFRGRGAGRALLEAVIVLARERGCARVEWSVLDWNEPAIRFYESLGARPQDAWTIYRLVDGPDGDGARPHPGEPR